MYQLRFRTWYQTPDNPEHGRMVIIFFHRLEDAMSVYNGLARALVVSNRVLYDPEGNRIATLDEEGPP